MKTPLDKATLESTLGSNIPDEVMNVLALLPNKYNAHLSFRKTSVSLNIFRSALQKNHDQIAKVISQIEAMSPYSDDVIHSTEQESPDTHVAVIDKEEDLLCHVYSETIDTLRNHSDDLRNIIQRCNNASGKFLFRHSEDSLSASAYDSVVKIYIATLKVNKISASMGRSASFSPAERLLHAAFPRKVDCEIETTARSYRYSYAKLARAQKA